jgi:hypothetical protein
MMLKLMTFVRPIRHLPPEVTRRQVVVDVGPVVLDCAFSRRLELGGESRVGEGPGD